MSVTFSPDSTTPYTPTQRRALVPGVRSADQTGGYNINLLLVSDVGCCRRKLQYRKEYSRRLKREATEHRTAVREPAEPTRMSPAKTMYSQGDRSRELSTEWKRGRSDKAARRGRERGHAARAESNQGSYHTRGSPERGWG